MAPSRSTPTGGFTYTPAGNYNGADSFTYSVSDGSGDSGIVTVTITVNGVNDAPVAVAESFSTIEDTPLVVDAPGVTGNDSDVDGDALSALMVRGPRHGTLVLNVDGSFSYAPASNYDGADSFTYKVNDGTADSNVVTVAIAISDVIDAPVSVDNSYTKNEDTTLSVAAPGVLGNDRAGDSPGPMTAVLTSQASHGSVTLNCGRQLQLHARGRLQRNRQFHVSGARRHDGVGSRNGHDHRQSRQRSARNDGRDATARTRTRRSRLRHPACSAMTSTSTAPR